MTKKKRTGVRAASKGHALAAGKEGYPKGNALGDGTFNHQRHAEQRGNVVMISARKALRSKKKGAARKPKRSRKR
jgi:hypothetical protein